MKKHHTLAQNQQYQASALLLFIVVVGYLVTFMVGADNNIHYSIPQLVVGISMGVFFLALAGFEEEILGSLPNSTRQFLFFSIECSLAFGIGWVLGPGGNLFIGAPLAAMAATRLSSSRRWPVYAGLVASVALPVLHYSNWQAALMNALIDAATLLFVVITTAYRLSGRETQDQAEGPAKELEGQLKHLAGRGTAVQRPLEEPLSARELEVLRLMATGLSNREIASRLIISPGTAKTHIHHLCGKLGVRNRTEAAMKAREMGLV
jgi:DNA-binding CsgD family transcriptional regulator